MTMGTAMAVTMAAAEFTIGADGIARLQWTGILDPDEATAAAAAALGQVRRVEAEVPDGDRESRRALHIAGFRCEGVRRRGSRDAAGMPSDGWRYARLADDEVDGAAAFSSVMNSVLPRTRTIAHVLFNRVTAAGSREYLFCQTVFKSDWELPGGVVERGESPRGAAIREVAEELGIDVQLGELLAIDWLPPYLGWDDALELIFDGGQLAEEQVAAMTLQPSEIAAVHWREPDEAYPLLRPGAARRLQLMTEQPTTTHYLEDGRDGRPQSMKE